MNCDCHCNGKCKLLGGLEQKIMEVLWSSSEPQKPADVLRKIEGKYAYTTVMTVLKRMVDKQLIKRRLHGNVYLYSAITDKSTFAATCLDDLFTRLFAAYGDYVSASFHKIARVSGIKPQLDN